MPVVLSEPEAPEAALCTTTLADVINRTRQSILTGRREKRNWLADAVTVGATTLTLEQAAEGTGIVPGATLAIDLELFHVKTVSGSTVTVTPGDQGSTPADHDEGATVRINTRVSDFDILNATNDVLRDLSSPGSGLFRVALAELVVDNNLDGYDVVGATNLRDVLEVSYLEPSNTQRWIRVNRKYWRLERGADTTMFPSGYALTFFTGFAANDGDPVRVRFKSEYLPLSQYADNVEDVTGLHCAAHPLLWNGATIRLVASREIERNQTMSEGQARRAGETPAGSVLQSYRGVDKLYMQLLRAEAARLARDWPTYYR